MNDTVYLVDNLLDLTQYPDHTLTAEEEATGNEVTMLSRGTRSGLDTWSSTTANSSTWFKVQCDRMRTADMIAIDRGHNLAGKTITLEVSNDNTNWDAVLTTGTIPAFTAPGSIEDPVGVLTHEGAWLYRFTMQSAIYWRVTIPALGAGLVPIIPWTTLGLTYSPDFIERPYSDSVDDFNPEEITTTALWTGRGTVNNRKRLTAIVKLNSFFAYDQAALHLEGLFGNGYSMWTVHDKAESNMARVMGRPPGTQGFRLDRDWGFKQAELEMVEYQPRRPRLV